MVDPAWLCQNHLLGEHRELHALATCVERGHPLDGFIRHKLVEVHNIKTRHDALVAEFRNRGWSSGFDHKTPIGDNFQPYRAGVVDSDANRTELIRRCSACLLRILGGVR